MAALSRNTQPSTVIQLLCRILTIWKITVAFVKRYSSSPIVDAVVMIVPKEEGING